MNALNTMILSLYAQAASSAAPAVDSAAPAPPALDEASLEAARRAAEESAKTAAGQGGSLTLLDLWDKLEGVEKGVMVILALCAVYTLALLFEKVWVMRANNAQIKNFLSAFRKANSVEEAEAIVRDGRALRVRQNRLEARDPAAGRPRDPDHRLSARRGAGERPGPARRGAPAGRWQRDRGRDARRSDRHRGPA